MSYTEWSDVEELDIQSSTRIAISRAHSSTNAQNSVEPNPTSNSRALYHSKVETTHNCLTTLYFKAPRLRICTKLCSCQQPKHTWFFSSSSIQYSLPTYQPTKQPANEPTNQPTSQQTCHLTNQATDQASNPPSNQATSRPTNKPTNKPQNNQTENTTFLSVGNNDDSRVNYWLRLWLSNFWLPLSLRTCTVIQIIKQMYFWQSHGDTLAPGWRAHARKCTCLGRQKLFTNAGE